MLATRRWHTEAPSAGGWAEYLRQHCDYQLYNNKIRGQIVACLLIGLTAVLKVCNLRWIRLTLAAYGGGFVSLYFAEVFQMAHFHRLPQVVFFRKLFVSFVFARLGGWCSSEGAAAQVLI